MCGVCAGDVVEHRAGIRDGGADGEFRAFAGIDAVVSGVADDFGEAGVVCVAGVVFSERVAEILMVPGFVWLEM